MLVDGAETSQKFLEAFPTDGHRERRSHRGIHGITSAHPVPKTEGVAGVDAEVRDLVQGGGHRHKVLGDSVFRRLLGFVDDTAFLQATQQPGAGGFRVSDGF